MYFKSIPAYGHARSDDDQVDAATLIDREQETSVSDVTERTWGKNLFKENAIHISKRKNKFVRQRIDTTTCIAQSKGTLPEK